MTSDPMSRPGEIAGWPKLVLRYRSDAAKVAALLPPGLDLQTEPIVQIGIYCVPVNDEPEYGVSTKIPARYSGMDGQYTLGVGIDQEAAIFNSRERNGQPKFPCTVRLFRFGDRVEATCTHQGYTFLEYRGNVTSTVGPTGEPKEENEWWIKSSRAIGGAERSYDFPPHVVRVRTVGEAVHTEVLTGEMTIRDSPWDPYTELLPVEEVLSAELVTNRFTAREITNAGPLDAEAFWPFVDTIGGSRWPGTSGGPRSR